MKLSYIITDETNPYRNLALEEYLLWHVAENECIFYIWQNRHTVVIGINQNAWKECHAKELEDSGGFLVRRMSGGGAVFHDLGNLNFTFLVREENYDVARQLDVIVKAIGKLGVKAERSGRNDILADGKKFSGNAFLDTQGHCYHHGTLLVDVDMSNLSRYLNVSHAKLQSKGVESVRSRVVNLKELAPDITLENLKKALVEAFGEVYGGVPQPLPPELIDKEEIERYYQKFSSWEWKFGRKLPFTTELSERFAWGDITLQFCVEGGMIREAVAYSDSMDTTFIKSLGASLAGLRFSSQAIKEKLTETSKSVYIDKQMLDDIIGLVEKNNF
jgi:lipoate-protein ligase A